jgi:chromosome segregation ATPase
MSDTEETQGADVRDSVPSDSSRVVKDVSIEIDPHAKAKKIGVAFCVIVLAGLAVLTFGLMQGVYSNYFEYKATENLAKERLGELQGRVREAEARMKARGQELEAEFSRKHDAALEEHENYVAELSAAYQKKKEDLAAIVKGFVERVQARTNDLNEAILGKERELEKLKEEVARLPNVRESLRDVQAQFVAESNLLVRARQERDQAMEGVREAQASYGEWQAKESAARAAAGEWEARKGVLEKDVDELVQETNRIERVIVELKKVRREVVDERDELKKVEGELSAAKVSLEEKKRAMQEAEEARLKAVGEKTRAETDAKEYERVSAALSSLRAEEKELKARIAKAKGDAEKAEEMGKEIAALQARLKDLTRETKEAEAARGVALDQKRAAESARDKAQNGCERIEAERVQAEASWKKRKEEIETLTKGMEDIFNLRWSSFVK